METFEQKVATPLYLQIAKHIEDRIIKGELKNGSRLNTTQDLAKHYRVTPVTIQKSLEQLVKRDLLERVPRRGTFVKSTKTANTIGIAFGYNPFRTQNAYYVKLLDLFRDMGEAEGINLKIYFNIHENTDKSRVVFDIKDDIAAGKLKGLIAINRSPELSNWLNSQNDIFWMSTPSMDYTETTRLGIDYLLKRGYRNIKFVSMFSKELLYDNHIKAASEEEKGCIEAFGGRMPEGTVVRWGQSEADGYNEAKKMFSNPESRPDAIFINHDVITKGAILALMELGLKIPTDVALLSHCNQGCDILCPVPLTTISFNPGVTVKMCCDAIKENLNELVPRRFEFKQKLHGVIIPGKSCGE